MKQIIKLILLPLILLVNLSCIAQKNDNKLSLDGTWDIIFDDNNQGIEEDWYLDGNFEKQDFEKIKVPSCWEESKKNYEGAGIYRTKFTNPEHWSYKNIQ